MEYFKHTYNGVEYDFEPNRMSQAKIDAIQKENRKQHSGAVEKLYRIEPKLKKLMAKEENLKKKVENEKDEKVSLEIQAELEKVVDDEATLLIQLESLKDEIEDGNAFEKQMYILLQEQRNDKYELKYPNLTEELFENICFDIERTYGHDEYEEICSAICEDVFTTAEEMGKAEYKSNYLRNRKKK